MKRTKTFVMKFLSVFALGALVLSSCTKDLEDRMDKVEEGLATVVKDVKALQDKLAAIEKTIPTDALDKIAALTTRIATLESKPAGMSEAEVTAAIDAAKTELNNTIKALPKISQSVDADGNIELTFTTDGTTEVLKFVGAESVTVTPDPATNMTTVTVGGETFSFPTAVVLPSTVTGIVLATDVTAGFDLEQDATFVLTISLNTTNVEQVALTAQNLVITNAYATKASIYEKATNMNITKVEANEGAVNEFVVTVQVKKVTAKAAYRLGVIVDETNVVRSEKDFNVTIKAFSAITKAKVTAIGATTAVDYTTTFGSVVVDNNTTDFAKTVEFTYFNANSNDITGSTEHFVVYANKITGATSVSDAISKAGFTSVNQFYAGDASSVSDFTTAFDALRGNASYPNAPTFAAMTADPTAAEGVKLNITLPAFDNATLGKQYYFVSILGQSKYDGSLIRNFGVVEVDMQNNQKFTVLPTTLNSVATMTYSVADALNASYAVTTGETAIVDQFELQVLDATGADVTGASEFSVEPALTGESRLGYTVELDPLLADGEYTVVITNTYARNNNLVITQKVTVACPTITFAAVPDVDGYALDGTFNSIAVSPLGFDYTFASHIGAIVGTYTDGVDYKIFYRVKNAAKYLDGVTDEDLATTYPFSETPATTITAQETEVIADGTLTDQRIAYDKTYTVDAYIVFATGHVKTISTGLTIKYATGATAVTGFLLANELTFVSTMPYTLERAASTTLDLAYVNDTSKPFYFSNGGTNIYLSKDDTKVLSQSVDYISDIAYKVLAVTYDATKMTVTGGTVDDTYTFVKFSNSSTSADNTAITTAGFNAKYEFAKVSGNGSAITKVLAPFVQPIEVTVTDVWGRVATLKINVTITEPAI